MRSALCFAHLMGFVFTLQGCGLNPPGPGTAASSLAGRVAPEIFGEDVDGKFFKLSDYKGKVVMLTFWAEW